MPKLEKKIETEVTEEIVAEIVEPKTEVKAEAKTEDKPKAVKKSEKAGDKKSGEKMSKQTKKAVTKAVKTRSARYMKLAEQIDVNKKYTLAEAVELVKATSKTKFDSSIELHIHLNPKRGKKGVEDEYARGIYTLPNGSGKKMVVVILDEAKIEEIAKTKKIDFDVAIAMPSLMPKLGKIAKILGPKGKMPNPKIGTVTNDPEAIKKDIEGGRVEYRQDKNGNIHQMVGKASWEVTKIVENCQMVLKSFTANRVNSVTIASTMGPSAKIATETVK